MMRLVFPTGNTVKFHLGERICKEFGIELVQEKLDIDEIQSMDGEEVALRKAAEAFKRLNKPVVVTDDTWTIPGLGGFPGTYMHAMNKWLSAEDWLRLTLPLKDRRIILRQILVYQDDSQQKMFIDDIEGILLTEVRGDSEHPSLAITSFDKSGQSVAEQRALGKLLDDTHTVWHEFGPWFAHHKDNAQ